MIDTSLDTHTRNAKIYHSISTFIWLSIVYSRFCGLLGITFNSMTFYSLKYTMLLEVLQVILVHLLAIDMNHIDYILSSNLVWFYFIIFLIVDMCTFLGFSTTTKN